MAVFLKNDCRTGKRISTSCRQNWRGLRHIAFKEHRHLMFKNDKRGLNAFDQQISNQAI
jgi:hypothetical protein